MVTTRLRHNVTVREENALAALEVMSRFAANPKWLIYLTPTMSPTETSLHAEFLEHPAEAFAYFRREGIPKVVCEEKHMGSRAVVIVCKTKIRREPVLAFWKKGSEFATRERAGSFLTIQKLKKNSCSMSRTR